MEGKPKKTKIVLDGITIKDDDSTENYIETWVKTDTAGTNFIRSITVTAKRSLEQVIPITPDTLINKEIIVTRGVDTSTESIIFKGYVMNYNVIGGVISLDCSDKLASTLKRTITYSFDKDVDAEAGVISEIFKTIINDNTDLVADDTSVQNSGTQFILSKFVCNSEPVYDKCKQLADAIGWIFWYNPETDKVKFEPKGFVNNSSIIQFGVNLIDTPKWEYDESNLYNEVRVNGAEKEAETSVIGQIGVTPGFTTTSVQLQKVPVSTRVLCDANNPPTTERVAGVPQSTSTYDYYIDETKKQIIWNTAKYTPTANHYCQVFYSYILPVPILVRDTDSISKYGLKQITLSKPEYKAVADAEKFANQYLEDHKEPVISTTLKVTNIKDLDVGQQVFVVDPVNNISDYFKITSVTMGYSYAFDSVKVTSDILEESDYVVIIMKKLAQLEKQSMHDYDSLVHIVNLTEPKLLFEERYFKVLQNIISGSDGFIFGHPMYGKIGMNTLGAPTGTGYETQSIQYPNTTYTELFYDDEFKDATTSGDWQTNNCLIELEPTEIGLSLPFAYNLKTDVTTYYKSVKYTITGTALDQLTYYIGEKDDVGNIEYTQLNMIGTPTNRMSVVTTLTHPNNYGLLWKIENTGSSTATITKLEIKYETI